ncbi:MAG: hypothetical protein JW716_04980 [Candidatus Aenigmarchaeota archaeon]|nr:hypothetical protein [Candidatus Aenigmarchaeota archaeon]
MDFTASIVILLIIIVPALLLWYNASSESTEQRNIFRAERQVLTVTDMMMATPGVPSSWNNTTVISVGFATEKNILEDQKLSEFNRTDYQKLKTIFGYDFYFELKDINGTVYYTKGQQPSFQNTTMPVERRGIYNDRIVILDLTVWY